MNDDLVGIEGLLRCIVLLVLYALAIGAKTKQQLSKPFAPIKPRPTSKIVTPKPVDPAYERHLRAVLEWSRKAPGGLILRFDIMIPSSGINTKNGGGTTMIKWLIKCLPRRSRASDIDGLKQETIEEIPKHAPKGNMTPEEVYYAFDYDDDKPWLWRNS